MSAIEASLAALKEASALASRTPFIAPVAGLLLQALTMRDASVPLLTVIFYLTSTLTGGEAEQGRVGCCHGQT
jgi:hypothetical protein